MPTLITDLDNTLYDWVTFFAKAFGAMISELSRLLGVEEAQLIEEFKKVNQFYGTSEQPFAALDLPSVKARFQGISRRDVTERIDSAFHAFNSARNKYLRLYESVDESLKLLAETGCPIIGHTEASRENAYFRLEKLNVRKLFRRLYVVEGHATVHPDPNRLLFCDPPEDFIHSLPRSERKPNPAVLLDICEREGVSSEEAWYVGDSLTRDVSMAKQAGVRAVWARYGTKYDKTLWSLLVRVTHWTEEDVQREAALTAMSQSVEPDYIIDRFSELPSLMGYALCAGKINP